MSNIPVNFLLWLQLFSCFLINPTTAHAPPFPAILVFGDSTVDTGNNNYIPTAFKANHSPYGKDYPKKQQHTRTGRFSNGLLVPDLLASELGIKATVPAFLDPSLPDDELRTGVCFASAGSGFDHLTTAASGVIPVLQQPEMFRKYIERLKGIVGEESANNIVGNALIFVSAGTNDFVYNWYAIPSRRIKFDNISSYQDFLHQKLQILIKDLYDLGGRKFAVVGLGPIGCLPIQMTARLKHAWIRTCVEEENSDAVMYNKKLQELLPAIRARLEGTKLAFVDLLEPAMDIISHPKEYGILVTSKGCCGSGYVEIGPFCNPISPVCNDASKYMFWDSVHPTEAVYRICAKYIIDNVIPALY